MLLRDRKSVNEADLRIGTLDVYNEGADVDSVPEAAFDPPPWNAPKDVLDAYNHNRMRFELSLGVSSEARPVSLPVATAMLRKLIPQTDPRWNALYAKLSGELGNAVQPLPQWFFDVAITLVPPSDARWDGVYGEWSGNSDLANAVQFRSSGARIQRCQLWRDGGRVAEVIAVTGGVLLMEVAGVDPPVTKRLR